MTLKNIFGSKKEALAGLGDLPPARHQHYLFAHRLLPTLTYRLGAMTVLMLANPEKSREFLEGLWQDAAHDVPPAEQIAPDGLESSVTRTDDKLIAIVGLPAAKNVTEAHFVAIVSGLVPEPPADDSEEARAKYGEILKQTAVEYFTLENGFTLDDTPRTAFCAWTREGAHQNMGDGPAPTADAFLSFLVNRTRPEVQAQFSPPSE